MSRPNMTVLSKNDIELVHDASLRMLSEVGVKIESPSVLAMMEKAGAKADGKTMIAKLDERMVSEALRTAPRKVKLSCRSGKEWVIPDGETQLVSPDGQPAAIFDIATGKRRPSTLKDVKELAIISDALPEIDYIWPPVVATDMPSDRSSFYEFLATIAYSSKHVQHGAASESEANFEMEVATAILGSREELRKRPIFSIVFTPISPLRYDRGEAEAMVVLARAGVPLVHLSMAIAGSVTPVTVAGSLAVINAENLCGLTITQTAAPGAPALYSSFSGVTDLKTGVFLCGTPEGVLMDVGAIEMARHYGLPTCAGGPTNVAKAVSVEAGYQSALTSLATVLAGADLMVGLGGMDRDSMVSPEKLVIDCEMWRWIRKLRAGVIVDDSSIGLEAVKRQGPGGVFLSDPHTLKHMRRDLMIPQVTALHRPGDASEGSDEVIEYAKRKVKEILATHKPPLLDRATAERVGEVARKYSVLLEDGSQIFEHA